MRNSIDGVLAVAVVVLGGYIWVTIAFADRVPPYSRIGLFPVSGLESSDVLRAIDAYEKEFARTKVTIAFRGMESTHTLSELGITLNKQETAEKIRSLVGRPLTLRRNQVVPSITFKDEVATKVLQADFGSTMLLAKNPTLALQRGTTVRIIPAQEGESIDTKDLNKKILEIFSPIPTKAITVSAIRIVPPLHAQEIARTQQFAESLLKSGFTLTALDRTFVVPPHIVREMMLFTDDTVPLVQFDEVRLKAYIVDSIVHQVRQDPVNARFLMQDGKVNQFALPQDGQDVGVDETVQAIATALAGRMQSASIAMRITPPLISDTGDSEKLGITTLLATGETNFRGSPKNRTKNIEVGTSKYNGILIAPNEEFSFNAFLGPVTKEAGFLPELVIKNNVTTPEFGGGLCQVSTTAFRAAVYSGMQITSRRNHSYAVQYYGTPGFDATIYPPYTDFRFLNNTPGYILIQTKIDGTKLSFEFWGTDDNRSVVVDGPNPYGRTPDGAVKSVLKQTVQKDGQTLVEDTFYSNYKSPNLFPHT